MATVYHPNEPNYEYPGVSFVKVILGQQAHVLSSHLNQNRECDCFFFLVRL